MDSTTPGSTSSSDLYSGSESDDPAHGQRRELSEQQTSNKRRCSNTSSSIRSVGSTDGPSREGIDTMELMLERSSSEHESSDRKVDNPIGTHKRKRSHESDDRGLRNIQAQDGGEVSTTSVGGQTPRKSSNSQIDSVLPRSPVASVNRSLKDDASSTFHAAKLVGKSPSSSVLVSSLPPEIWQNVFCFVPPVFLGRLLRVNHAFKSLLIPSVPVKTSNQESKSGAAKFQSADAIWAASRKRFCPGLPRPLRGLHELEMWRLLRGSNCQKCGKQAILLTSSSAANPFQCGPGETGVRVVWPFRIRCCGACLRAHSEKEVTLLVSSTFPSFLLPALPFAFLSQSGHYVGSTVLRNAAPPSDVQLTKHYYKLDIEHIRRQLQHVKELGSGSAEEWIKGLEDEGREKSNDAARWEQWEAKGGLKKVNSRPNPKQGSSVPKPVHPVAPVIADLKNSVGHNFHGKKYVTPVAVGVGAHIENDQKPAVIMTTSNNSANSIPGNLPQRPQPVMPQLRPERNIRDVNESKAARRAEIERRCMALDPPLEPTVLCHMESFQAALQISTMLTDSAWDVLKPRLLGQRESAELRERERVEQTKLLQAKSDERRQLESQQKEVKDYLDKEWDSIQAPVRDRLAAYADILIEEHWAGGSSVTKDNCPNFAADILLWTRERFYDDLAQEDNISRTSGELQPDWSRNFPTRKLILENMKWLFDNKVKNYTEHFQKELFLCNGCEGNFKFYGFEGVIQHYAAKHTTALSTGKVVVDWRAEWPEQPPFHPNPSAAKTAFYAIPPPMSTSIAAPYSRPPHTTAGYGEYGKSVVLAPQSGPGHSDHYTPAPYNPHYSAQIPTGAYYPTPSSNFYPLQPGFHGLFPGSQLGGQHLSSSLDSSNGLGSGYRPFSELQGNVGLPYTSTVIDNSYSNTIQQPVYSDSYTNRYPGSTPIPPSIAHLPPKPMTSHFSYDLTQHGLHPPGTDLYQTQMNEMAQHARDVWFGTSGIKDIPQSVRIYVVIHHVVSRFESRYTNEPSLAMFIDGLDHNSLMRPVRSLNGLACKTCVTNGNGSGGGYHAHPQHSTIDRKLYTLPHLLNHFNSVHVEKMPSTMDIQSGSESSRLDWKRDMIELPEAQLIADLINAAGVDDKKLQLIATVFPQLFPTPLPRISSSHSFGPIPKFGMDETNGKLQWSKPDAITEAAPLVPYQNDTPQNREIPAQSRTASSLGPLSRSSTRGLSEPPGDDEYDPNRPAYYGKIVDPTHFNIGKTKSSSDVILPHAHLEGQNGTTGEDASHVQMSEHSRERFEADAKPVAARSNDDHQLRHSGQPHDIRYVDYGNRSKDSSQAPVKNSKLHKRRKIGDPYRYVSEDGEVVEETTSSDQKLRSTSRIADVTAAEKFLDNFIPGEEPDEHERENEMRNRSYPRPINEVVTRPHIESNDRSGEKISRRVDDLTVERSMQSTPSLTDRVDSRIPESLRYQPLSSQPPSYPYEVQPRSTSHVRYSYADESFSADEHAKHTLATRNTGQHVRPHSERILEVSRNAQQSSQWPQVIPRRSRSRSPIQISRGMEQYRIRSPRPTSPHGPIYHIDSPSIPVDGRSQRIVRYAYVPREEDPGRPRAQGYAGERYEQRVEYIPIRANDYQFPQQSRYVISQPIEQRRPEDHVRMERGYAGQEVFERDGHFYYAEPRHLDSRTARTPNSNYIEYRNNMR